LQKHEYGKYDNDIFAFLKKGNRNIIEYPSSNQRHENVPQLSEEIKIV